MDSKKSLKSNPQKRKGYSFLEYLEQFDEDGLRKYHSENLKDDLFSKSVKQQIRFKQMEAEMSRK